MLHEMSGKEVTRDVVSLAGDTVIAAGEKLDAEAINAVLSSDAKEIRVRNNNVRGIEVEAIKEGDGIIESLAERIVGRVLAENIDDPETGERIASINDTVDEVLAERIEKVRDRVSIRSVLTCKSQFGVCIKCYGRDLANQAEVEIGEAVGIIAAQSIGEPGTQLTMRTFHSGGVAGDDITQGLPRVEELFELVNRNIMQLLLKLKVGLRLKTLVRVSARLRLCRMKAKLENMLSRMVLDWQLNRVCI